jgi:molybdate transport system substrate-binding protein
MQILIRVVLSAWLLALTGSIWAADITIFAAASLKESLDENIKAFAAKTGNQVRVSYAGSNALARQIESGAPADLFISADEEWMDYVAQKNLLAPGTRRNLVVNSLVLIAPAASTTQLTIAPKFPLAASLKGGRLALANPQAVPIGKYAKAALTTLGVWGDVETLITNSENVRSALMLVALGETPLGIVYATDAKAEPKVRVVDTFAANLHPPVVYPAAVIAGKLNPVTQSLLDYLVGDEGRAVWVRYGFGIAR